MCFVHFTLRVRSRFYMCILFSLRAHLWCGCVVVFFCFGFVYYVRISVVYIR